jgi:hypothetical protein
MSAPVPTTPPRRLEDHHADALRRWREMGGTRAEFDLFWPLIRDRLLEDLRRAA